MPHRAWNKGLTKKSSAGLARIAKARRAKNNFTNWHKNNPVYYAPLEHSPDLAELYGTMLGDGCIENHPRTERLIVSFHSKEQNHIQRIKELLARLFHKDPSLRIHKTKQCVAVSLYQKNISIRLNFPKGEKYLHDLRIPEWIKDNKDYLIPCLRGLFETDGSWVIDPKYNTNCINYTSIHKNLLLDIRDAMRGLGFSAGLTTRRVILSRRAETAAFAKLIKFRQY